MITGDSVGGAARRVAPEGDGSSPSLPAVKRRLRRELSRLDRRCESITYLKVWDQSKHSKLFEQLDAKRKAVRLKLKSYKRKES